MDGREDSVKEQAHALQLVGDTPGLLFAPVTDDSEVLAADFQPVFLLVARRS
jgi:hypothetical protein